MMHADLIDQDDLLGQMRARGFDIPAGASAEPLVMQYMNVYLSITVLTYPLIALTLIACGALAHEITALRKVHGWLALDVHCLPPELHNRPERIPAAVRAKIQANRGHYTTIFVAYGDCGTGGLLDVVLQGHAEMWAAMQERDRIYERNRAQTLRRAMQCVSEQKSDHTNRRDQ